MSGKELRSLSLSIGSTLLPTFSLVSANAPPNGDNNALRSTCHGKLCHPIEEYCSTFTESCMPCASICDPSSHNYVMDTCAKECSAYNSYEPLKAQMHELDIKLNIIMGLVIGIIIVMLFVFIYWLQQRRCMRQLLSRLMPKPHQSNTNGKNLNATTIQNMNAINRDIERAPSQIYSVAGAAEGSVLTMATPVSTRYPAENSTITTPTTVVTEIGYGYGYDNQAMVVTPVAEKAPTTTTTPTAAAGF